MEKDPANVIPVDIMFDIQKMLKNGNSQEEILRQFTKKNLDNYIKAYIERLEIKAKKELPFEVEGAVIYYVGPSPTKENEIIGSAGPTTSYRMDAYSPSLLELGLKGMIGKGQRNLEVRESIVKNKAIYFGATGGAAALIAKSVKKNELIAYEDLGAEAIRKLYVEDFPLTVINDIYGNDLYSIGKEKYRIVED